MMVLRKSRSISKQSRTEITEFIGKHYSLEGPFVYSKVSDLEGAPKVRSGECAALVQWHARVGLTKNWRQGIPVRGNGGLIKKGTAIATFEDGFYPNRSHGNHAAFYLWQNDDGIQVMDQWSGLSKPTISSRLMKFKGKKDDDSFEDPSNNGDALSVIMKR